MGCTALRVLTTNSSDAIAIRPNSPMQAAENQPEAGACFRPISSAASESDISISETTSNLFRCESRALPHGSKAATPTTITAPGRILIRNSHCQE